MQAKQSRFSENTIYSLRRLLNTKSAFLITAILFKMILECGYIAYVHPKHGYSGFSWNPNYLKYLESWILFFVLILFAPYRLQKPSDFLINTLLFGLMAPLFSYYGMTDQSRLHLYIVILGYVLISVFQIGRTIRFPILKQGRITTYGIVGTGIFIVSAWYIVSGGILYFNLDLTQVYKYRHAVSEVINVGPMGYVNNWAWKVFGPTMLAVFLWRKKYLMVLLVVGLHIFWFGISAHKSVLFTPLLVFFLYFWLRRTNAISILPLCLVAVIGFSLFSFLIFDFSLPASLFIRRVFYVIAKNTFVYYEFFSDNPLVWWSNSSVSFGMISYPYEIGPAELIGRYLNTDAHVNNTFLSTGFMHAGILGIVIYGIVAGILFRLIDSLTGPNVPIWVALSVLIVPTRSFLLSTDLPTALLTHGILIGIIILFLLNKRFDNIVISCR